MPDDENMMFRKIRNGIEIGVAPMLYGYNIKAGLVGDNSYWLDYSAGTDIKEVEDLYSLIISIINKRMDEFDADPACDLSIRSIAFHTFKDFPRQEVKPMCNDQIDEMCGKEIISIKLPCLPARKVRHTLEYHFEQFEMINNMGGFDDLLGSEE